MSTPESGAVPADLDVADLDVWVLAGQSNMRGCGLLTGVLEPDERVWNFSSAGKWETAADPLHRLWESYTPVQQKLMRAGLDVLTVPREGESDAEIAEREAAVRTSGAGLGVAFGKAMADATGKPIGLISAAHGATTLELWNPERKGEGAHSLYGALLQRVRDAGGKVRGVLWYQGESDCTPEAAPLYAARFAKLVEALRADLNSPDLPVIAVQLGRVLQPENGDGVWKKAAWETVREAQRLLPETIAHTAVTSAVDLGLCDRIHIDTPGLIRLGRRMARLALSLQSGSTPVAPRLIKIESGPTDAMRGMGTLRVVCDGVAGGWNPQNHMAGFQVCDADGEIHPTTLVVDASADTKEPKVINVIVSPQPDDSIRLAYGVGLNPYCNVVDNADQPLPAFMPQPIA